MLLFFFGFFLKKPRAKIQWERAAEILDGSCLYIVSILGIFFFLLLRISAGVRFTEHFFLLLRISARVRGAFVARGMRDHA